MPPVPTTRRPRHHRTLGSLRLLRRRGRLLHGRAPGRVPRGLRVRQQRGGARDAQAQPPRGRARVPDAAVGRGGGQAAHRRPALPRALLAAVRQAVADQHAQRGRGQRGVARHGPGRRHGRVVPRDDARLAVHLVELGAGGRPQRPGDRGARAQAPPDAARVRRHQARGAGRAADARAAHRRDAHAPGRAAAQGVQGQRAHDARRDRQTPRHARAFGPLDRPGAPPAQPQEGRDQVDQRARGLGGLVHESSTSRRPPCAPGTRTRG